MRYESSSTFLSFMLKDKFKKLFVFDDLMSCSMVIQVQSTLIQLNKGRDVSDKTHVC